MPDLPPTLIIRHHKENLAKCSVRGFGRRPDCSVMVYPACADRIPPLDGRIWLTLDGEPLSTHDADTGLVVLDATWRHEQKMASALRRPLMHTLRRSIPPGFLTAYPRKPTDCPDPAAGLATVEAIYIAYRILRRDTAGLFDHYHWADRFLQLNAAALETLDP